MTEIRLKSLATSLNRLCCCLFLTLILIPDRVAALGTHLHEAVADFVLVDDADRQSLVTAARRQAQYLKFLPGNRQLKLANGTISIEELRASMASFLAIVSHEQSPKRIRERLRDEFALFPVSLPPDPESDRRVLVTGYFEPVLEGSLSPGGPYTYPLFKAPSDLVSWKSGERTMIGRRGKSGIIPYWTRREIEKEARLAGNELVYLHDPVEAFILHIQGSGKIRLPDGSLRPVRYAASNGHPYRSIGKLLVDEGRLTREEATLPGIEKYLRDHPEDMWRVLHANPRYIFFDWGKEGAVRGSAGTELTPGRSIAVDPSVVPLGSIAFIMTRIPVFNETGRLTGWQPLRRFVFPQDSGAAIKGSGRIDLFLGNGREARLAAGQMREDGACYILLKK